MRDTQYSNELRAMWHINWVFDTQLIQISALIIKLKNKICYQSLEYNIDNNIYLWFSYYKRYLRDMQMLQLFNRYKSLS